MGLLSILRVWSECLIPAWFLRNLYLQTTRRLQKEAAPVVHPTGPFMAKKIICCHGLLACAGCLLVVPCLCGLPAHHELASLGSGLCHMCPPQS